MENDNMILLWIIAMVIFFATEMMTMGLATIWFAFGSLAALISAFLGAHLFVQIFLFLSVSIILLVFTKPLAKGYFKIGNAKTNLDSVIGSSGIIIEKIEPFKYGQVKVSGQIWTAASEVTEIIEAGEKVIVTGIEGVKLIVKKI